MRYFLLLSSFALLSGCSIVQKVEPVAKLELKEVCIIDNPLVTKQAFFETYRDTLHKKGFVVKKLAPNSASNSCPVTSTYTANWKWDMALYLSYADIKIFREGVQAGSAVYDAREGQANMSKFIKGEEKVKELVELLFP